MAQSGRRNPGPSGPASHAHVAQTLLERGIDTTRTPHHRVLRAMPSFVTDALRQRGLVEAYDARPPNQRNDYLIWIVGAKLRATRGNGCT